MILSSEKDEKKHLVSSKEAIKLEDKYGARNYSPIPVVIAHAEGVWVYDPEGNRYLDCLSAYSAVNQGHRHPRIIDALKNQAERLTLTSRAFYNDRLGLFLKHLCEYAEMEMALPMNTGAEAVETAIKMARKWGYEQKKIPENQAEIIVANNNFHGRTTTIVGFSTDPTTTKHFGPATPGFNIIPFDNPEALEKAITPNTCAFLVEPIQGEAGVIIPKEDYLKKIRKICSQNNVLLMLDEIQTGLGRTGKKFAFQHENIKPDVIMVGKALGGGIMPVSAVLSSKELMNVFSPGTHGSTFGGNPLGCAIAEVAMNVIEEEHLAENSAKLGYYFKEKLDTLIDKSAYIKEIRGKGLFLAIEFKTDSGITGKQIAKLLMKKGVLAKDTHEYSIRFAPPLVIDKEQIDWAFTIIENVILNVKPEK
ncbi:MAG: ornithine--oxo-acid transaminase [Candidatus Hodarchaeales archaeon]|jgi:ornithine--oxo-acid transaminase